jgi:DNA-binding GntR family transcriptional regulator
MKIALTIRDQVAIHLRRRILSGELPAGTALLEAPLAEEFGVSRGPIRDAFLTLTKEGLLSAKPNVGTRVAEGPSPFKRSVIVQMRRDIESAALTAWFDAGSPELLEHLTRNLATYHDACAQGELAPVVEIDMTFHRLLVASADGGSLVELWSQLIMQIFLRYSRHRSLLESHAEHATLVAAMGEGRKADALAALRAHIV